jgi:hypothetical protein
VNVFDVLEQGWHGKFNCMDVQYFTLNLIEPELPLLKHGEENGEEIMTGEWCGNGRESAR